MTGTTANAVIQRHGAMAAVLGAKRKLRLRSDRGQRLNVIYERTLHAYNVPSLD